MVSEKEVWAALKKVIDPEIGISVVDLGLIYNVSVDGSRVNVKMTLTNPYCPMQNYLKQQVHDAAAGLDGVTEASIELVFEPAWGPERISKEAREKLGITL